MTSFEDELRRAYHPSQLSREQKLEAAAKDLERGKTIANRWPEQRKLVKGRIIPRLKTLRKNMKLARKPKELKELNRAFKQYNNMRMVTWWHPSALWLRARMLFYVGSLFVIGLGLLVLIGLMVWFVLQLLMRAMDMTGGLI